MKRSGARLSAYFRARDRGRVLALLAAVCALYLPFLGNPLVFDDVPLFSGGFLDYYAHAPFKLEFRWFHFASMGWTARVFSDLFPQPFRLGNLLLHAANAIVLFHVLRQLLAAVLREQADAINVKLAQRVLAVPLAHRERGNGGEGNGHGESPPRILEQRFIMTITWGAWLGALIFALHPLAVYATGYVAERSILLATLFVLLAQWAYLRALLSGQAKWLPLALLAFFIACFSKEHSVTLPAVLAAMTLLLRRENRLSRPALAAVWCAFTAIALLVVLIARGKLVQVLGTAYEPMAVESFAQQDIVAGGAMLHLLSVLTQAGLFFKYLLLWALPNPAWMSIDMREPFVASLSAWQGWLGAAGFALYGAVAVRLLLSGGMKGLAGLALLYPWLLFFTEFSTVRVQEPFVLYRSYLWMPGLMLLIPLLLLRFPQRKTLLLSGCVVVLLIPLALNRLWVFGDNYRLWNDAALLLQNERVAGADRIYYNRGQALLAQQKWAEAARDFERAAAISPQLAPIHYMLGMAYGNAGRYEEALQQFDATLAINADDDRAYFAKGFTLKRMHRDREAMQQMEQSCRLKNQSACLLVSMSQSNKH